MNANEQITSALQYLAGVCNFAQTKDNVGFNGADTVFGHDLADKSLAYPLSPKQLEAAFKMLGKYRAQLHNAGFELPESFQAELLPAVEKPAKVERPAVTVSSVKLTLEKGRVSIRFPYDPNLVAKVKSLSERKWNPDDKIWTAPTRLLDEILEMFPGAQVDPALLQQQEAQQARAALSNQADANFDVPGLNLPLLPFQRAGVQFLELANGRALVADEMGLGKTVQALAYLQLHPELRPALLVVPASLKINWQREAARWLSTPENISILSGKKCNPAQLELASLIIVNYDILSDWQECFLNIKPAVMICDEAHYIKHGSKTLRGKAVIAMSKKIARTILLTGTPVTNRPAELFPLLNILDNKAWGNFMSFAERYCDAKHNGFGWDFSGASNLHELNEKIKPWVVRRIKSQVLTELPAKRRVTLPLEFDKIARREYMDMLEAARAASRKKGAQAEQLTMFEKAKQAAVKGKMKQAIKWIEDFIESEKLILFCTHKNTVAELMEYFGNAAVKVTGDSSQADRQAAVDRFQADDTCRLFVGNIQAAGVGLTLTAASNVAFLEFAWQPGEHLQAEDRAHRIGQKESVTCWYLVATGTIDETIVRLLEQKAAVVDAVTDGREVSDFNLLGELLAEIEKEVV